MASLAEDRTSTGVVRMNHFCHLDAKCVFVHLPLLIRDMLLGFVPDTRSSESAVCPVGFISLGKKDNLFEHKALSMAKLFYIWVRWD